MAKVLVTGANGMVGQAIKEVFSDDELILTDIHDLDVRVFEQVESYYHDNVDLIIHLAAMTDLEDCENDPGNAFFTNHTGTINVLEFAQSKGIPLVYISTAGVFDGVAQAYNDDDMPYPINTYGRSKYYGEFAVQQYEKAWIFRASWMMGGGKDKDKKFVKKIYDKISAGERNIYAINNTFGSPTYTIDLARTIKFSIENELPYGLYNCGGSGRASRYDVACEIIRLLKVDAIVQPVNDKFFEQVFFCPRPSNEVLHNTKLLTLGYSQMRHWKITLKEYLEKCFMD